MENISLESEKKDVFSRNKAKKLLKTKKVCGKRGQNKAKTKLAKLLKTRHDSKNKPKTNLKQQAADL